MVGAPRSAGAQPAGGVFGPSADSVSAASAAASAARAAALRAGPPASSPALESRGSHCRPALPASIASLASRSACLFSSRGIHSYVTREGGKTPRASAASGRMSGCLIFQRPDICSTTSLESIRTRTSASGSRACAARRPASSPRYSATLLVAVPMYSAASARVSPVSGSMTTAP